MTCLRKLIESRPMLIRIPDQSLIAGEQTRDLHHIQATRASDDSYAFIYIPAGRSFTIQTKKLAGKTIRAHWYDPRNGTSTRFGDFTNDTESLQFTPPSSGRGEDWILVLDDPAKQYLPPGITRKNTAEDAGRCRKMQEDAFEWLDQQF